MAKKLTEEEMSCIDRHDLIKLVLGMQDQVHTMDWQMQLMMGQIVLMKHDHFDRSSEKMDDSNQIRFMEVDGTIVFFNEAEAVSALKAAEPE